MKDEKKTIIFIDSGDTIVDEATQAYDDNGVIQRADFIDGMEKTLRLLKQSGHDLVLVADGTIQNFENVYRANGLLNLFSARVYSEAVGVCKPDQRMFLEAMSAVGLSKRDVPRIIMVGNNLSRDIRGANALGITSVFFKWSPRYPQEPADRFEQPAFTILQPNELIPLVEQLDALLREGSVNE